MYKQRGSALIITMIMFMIATGIITALYIVVLTASKNSQIQSQYLEALEKSQIGLNITFRKIKMTPLKYNSSYELMCFVEQDPDTIGNIKTIDNSNVGYKVQVRSAYLAHTLGAVEETYLKEIQYEVRNDPINPIFDYYEIRAKSKGVGEHDFQRGVICFAEIRKSDAAIPSALYIDNDPNPVWNGASWRVSGKDHSMAPTSGGGGIMEEDDYLVFSDKHKPAVGYDGEYSALGFTSSEEDQISTFNESGTEVTGEQAFVNTNIDLRKLACKFIGGEPTDPLKPDYSRVDNTTMSSSGLGDIDDFRVTYIGGDAGTVAGKITGGGVLVIDGSVSIVGQLTWYGLVIVLGDMNMSGGGAGIHVFGSIMVESESVVSGQADIWYSEEALQKLMKDCEPIMMVDVIPMAYQLIEKGDDKMEDL